MKNTKDNRERLARKFVGSLTKEELVNFAIRRATELYEKNQTAFELDCVLCGVDPEVEYPDC